MHIIVSDLHLGKGDDLDDFVFGFKGDIGTIPACVAEMDEKFGNFLKFLAGLSRPENPVTLVLLGDIFDLIQVTGCEGPAKLDAVRKAHTKFFEYLGSFADEHAVLYLVGNHDAEMLNPAMTDWLKKAVPKLQLDPKNLPLLFYQEGSLYCEHGNQLEGRPGYNIIENIYRDFVGQPFAASDYPAGSRFVLESVNSLETKYPDVDNILGDRRAATTWYILKKKGKNGFEQFVDLLRKVKSGVRTASVTSDDDALLLYSLLTGRPPDAADVERDDVAKQLDGMLRAYLGTKPGVQLAATRKGMWELFKKNIAWIAEQKERWANDVDENASRFVHNPGAPAGLLKQPDRAVRFIVCGHTHRSKKISSEDGQRAYINSGTWRHFLDPDTGAYTQNLTYVRVDGGSADLCTFT